MTHILDLSGSYEALFQLRHLVSGSREFCKGELLHFGDDDYTPEEWESYQNQLHFLVSRTLISSAINFRVLQDTLRSQSSARELNQTEEDLALTSDLDLGEVLEGEFDLTLRESCNKIIHATDFNLLFREARTGKPSKWYSYWNGQIRAVGVQGKKKWSLLLNVTNWCNAVDNYTACLAGDLDWP